MLIEKIMGKSNVICNLENKSLDNDFLIKKHLKKGQFRHNPSSVKEWHNSIYNIEKNNIVKTLPFKDKLIYKLFNTYFNLDKSKEYDGLSMGKTFVGKPEVKHFNNKIYIQQMNLAFLQNYKCNKNNKYTFLKKK